MIVAKNHLTEKELKSLNRIVTMYLDYAEDQAERHQPMYMKDWVDKLNTFLKFNERDILVQSYASLLNGHHHHRLKTL